MARLLFDGWFIGTRRGRVNLVGATGGVGKMLMGLAYAGRGGYSRGGADLRPGMEAGRSGRQAVFFGWTEGLRDRPGQVILDAGQIEAALKDITDRIARDVAESRDVAVIGLLSRGEVLAKRLSQSLGRRLGETIPCGSLDITLYRDDLNNPQGRELPRVRGTEIPFDIGGKVIILVDDVLHTGRSVRAAMDALVDFGRPRAVRLAVLVDRGHHELPIQVDYAGRRLDVPDEKSVVVQLKETDGTDQVMVE